MKLNHITPFITGLLEVNTYIVEYCAGKAFAVDAGGNSKTIIDFLAHKNLTLTDIVLTHAHFDHIGGLVALCSAFPLAKVHIHKNEQNLLGKDALKMQIDLFGRGGLEMYIKRCICNDGGLSSQNDKPFATDGALPPANNCLQEGDVLFADSTFFEGGFSVLHTAGHSLGSICLYNSAKAVLFSGDTLFAGTHGRTDLYGGDDFAMAQSLKRLCALSQNVTAYPGHNAPTTIKDFCQFWHA